VVLATVTSLGRELLDLGIEGEAAPLRLTAGHRLFSETRGDWVPAGELAVGDEVRTAAGPRRVASVLPLSGAHRVYNLEVQTRHCYHAGQTGILSHNACSCPAGPNSDPPSLSAHKKALRQVHDEVGKLPRGNRGRFGGPQAGDSRKGYGLDPAHPRAAPGSPEAKPHCKWWDYTTGKRSSGRGRDGHISIED